MTLGEIIRNNARRFPNDLALVFEDNRLSFGQFHARTESLANAFIGLGARKGDRVCIILENSHQYCEVVGAAWKAGLVAVTLSVYLKQELEHIVGNAAPTIFVTSEKYLNLIQPQWDSVKGVICIDKAPAGTHDYEGLIKKYPPDTPNVEVDGDDLSMIYYTSGTTGLPKGVGMTHSGQIKNAELELFHWGAYYHQNRSAAAVHPLYFSAPMNCTIIPNMLMANPVVILKSFSPQSFLETTEKERISDVVMVPTMIYRILEYSDLHRYDFSSLNMIGYGSAPMAVSVLKEALGVFGDIFCQGYGLTETIGPVTILPIQDHVVDGPENITRRLASCGRERLDCQVKVVREEGADVEPDGEEVGEIIVKGDNFMTGYFEMPEQTAKTVKEGWLYTGDMASIDEDGYVYIKDRKKDMIISGGINIYPWEVEDVLFEHPAVSEAAVIGKPDKEWGDLVKAFIVLKQGKEVTAEEIIDFTRERLATYKKPKEVEFVDSLPHGATGKVLRRELRDREASNKEL